MQPGGVGLGVGQVAGRGGVCSTVTDRPVCRSTSATRSSSEVGVPKARFTGRALTTHPSTTSVSTRHTVRTQVKSPLRMPVPCTRTGRPASTAPMKARITAAWACPRAAEPEDVEETERAYGHPVTGVAGTQIGLGGQFAHRVRQQGLGAQRLPFGLLRVDAATTWRPPTRRAASDTSNVPVALAWRLDIGTDRSTDRSAARCTTASTPQSADPVHRFITQGIDYE